MNKPIYYQHLPDWAYQVLNTEVDGGLDAYDSLVKLEIEGVDLNECNSFFKSHYSSYLSDPNDPVGHECSFALAFFVWEHGDKKALKRALSSVQKIYTSGRFDKALKGLGADDSYIANRKLLMDSFFQALTDTISEKRALTDEAISHFKGIPDIRKTEQVQFDTPTVDQPTIAIEDPTIRTLPPKEVKEKPRPSLLVFNGLVTFAQHHNNKKQILIQPTDIIKEIKPASAKKTGSFLLSQEYQKPNSLQTSSPTLALPAIEENMGTMALRLWATDQIGNAMCAETYIIIQDALVIASKQTKTSNPEMIAYNGLVCTLDSNGSATIYAWQFMHKLEGNMDFGTDTQDLRIAKGEAFTEVPETSSVTFGKNEQGTQIVQIWARASTGDWYGLLTYILVQDAKPKMKELGIKAKELVSVPGHNGFALCYQKGTKNTLTAQSYLLPAYQKQVYKAGIRYTQIGEYTPKLKVIPDNCGVYSIELYFEWKDGTKSIFESYLLQQFYDTAFAGASLQLAPKE